MAFGLRRIHNNRPPSLDGREWNIFGDSSFAHGRAAHPLDPRGSTATEILRAKATEKTAAAAAADLSLPGGARSSRGSSLGGRVRQRAVVERRWSRMASEPSLMNQMCPGVVEREAMKDNAAAPSLAAAAERKRRAQAAAGAEPYTTTSGDLYSPELRQPTFPVAKFHYHPESHTKRDPSQDAGRALTRKVPDGFLPTSPETIAVGKYRYFSDPMVAQSINFHHASPLGGLLEGRLTWRVPRGETLRALPKVLAEVRGEG